MMSCFEGLLEFYRITHIEKYKIAVINFADKVLESDFTVIGSSGCTHELFDHSTVRQANTTNGEIAQETCVTVTLMKLFWQLTRLTGDTKYADAFEIFMYNAYFGAINTERAIEPSFAKKYPNAKIEPLPFDSYSPLVAGTRGRAIGGFKIMRDGRYYGCCACIGSVGAGLIFDMAILSGENGFLYNLYIDGKTETLTPSGNKVEFVTETDYPVSGKIKITVKIEKEERFELVLRNPSWSKKTTLLVNGENILTENGNIHLNRIWNNGDVINLEADMRTEAIYPISYGKQVLMNKVVWGKNYIVPQYDKEDPAAKKHIALRRDPIMLAAEKRLGHNMDMPVDVMVEKDGYVKTFFPEKDIMPKRHLLEMCVPQKNGGVFRVIDYESAGKTWTNESKTAVWMLNE